MFYDILWELLCTYYVIISAFVVLLLINREQNWSGCWNLEHLEHTSSIVSKKVNGYKLIVYMFMNFAQLETYNFKDRVVGWKKESGIAWLWEDLAFLPNCLKCMLWCCVSECYRISGCVLEQLIG